MHTLSFPTRNVLLGALAALALLAGLIGSTGKADARQVWCMGDPAIIVNGNVISVTVHLPLDRLKDVNHVEVVFHVPSNANVYAVINDSLLFKAKIVILKDQPAVRGLLIKKTSFPVDVIVHHKGKPMPVAATTISVPRTTLWVQGTSASPLRITASGLLNLRLFR